MVKPRPTLLLCIEFSDFWWVPSVSDQKQWWLANCNGSENWIQTTSHSNIQIPFTLEPVLADDVAVCRCARRSRRWYFDGNVSCRCIVFHSEEFDAWYLDWRRRRSIGCSAPDDTDCWHLDDKEVVRIELHNGKPLVWIQNQNPHLIDFEWTEDMQAKLKTLEKSYTSVSASGTSRVHGGWLACCSLVLGDNNDLNNISRHWYNEWPLNTSVDSPITRWLRPRFWQNIVNEPAE